MKPSRINLSAAGNRHRRPRKWCRSLIWCLSVVLLFKAPETSGLKCHLLSFSIPRPASLRIMRQHPCAWANQAAGTGGPIFLGRIDGKEARPGAETLVHTHYQKTAEAAGWLVARFLWS
ncbi:hypothetical protein B0H66DRAFT_309378 [Apodospora peruviana]|uniref:Uncharacterized protein n=1 Tax=Apodospora peruviana TaxID=516989 RepID=A0AAE0I2J4_9PEZI|nr:hypothetical protein B0H66DRAFT_309378 [Apodospora peruviana]